jgi:protein-L-isoaspartate(D-aspartate) O-methyltransferase
VEEEAGGGELSGSPQTSEAMMRGWIVPPPKAPTKSSDDFRKEREEKVTWLLSRGYLRSERIRHAMLRVAREEFIPPPYRDYAYWEVPLPLPGARATVSCPHSYPLFYEPLGLDEGQRFLEVGLGSGYGAALAREIVGSHGLVVTLEIDPVTYGFARTNLNRAGYTDIRVVLGDGGLGYPALAPYDRICITAACTKPPLPLIEQLGVGGRLIGPVEEQGIQNLVLLEKHEHGLTREVICQVLYVPLRGQFGGRAGAAAVGGVR